MPFPERYLKQKFPLYELIGAGLVVIMLIVQLTRPYIGYEWLTDTLWLISALGLVFLEWNKEKPMAKLPGWLTDGSTSLLLVLYLVFYHFLQFILSVSSGDFSLVLALGALVVYSISLYFRLPQEDIQLKNIPWKKLIQAPVWPVTAALGLCFLAFFFHMTRMSHLNGYYGLQFGYSAYSGWGYNNWGYNLYASQILVKGFNATLGEAAGILVLFLMAFHIIQTAGQKNYSRLPLVFKIAVPVLAAWWILAAKGYNALKGFGTIIFLIGFLVLALSVYFPDKLGEWLKKIPKPAAKPPVLETSAANPPVEAEPEPQPPAE